jgi:hypothetical protein
MKTLLSSLLVFAFHSLLSQFQTNPPISPMVMGQNYHYTKWTNPGVANNINLFGTLYSYGSQSSNTVLPIGVAPSACKLMRIGGFQYNIGDERPLQKLEIYYVSIVDEIRKNGFEPLLTVPFLLNTSTVSSVVEPTVGTSGYTTALQNSINTATTILHLLNDVHGRNVKYVVIANEPDKDYGWKATIQGGTLSSTVVAQSIAGYVKPISDAIKSKWSSVRIIAPEYTECIPDVYKLLFNPALGNSAYSGGISSVSQQPYVDFISVHAYAADFSVNPDPNQFAPTFSSGTPWNAYLLTSNLEKYSKVKYDSPNSSRRYRGTLRYLRDLCISINNSRPSSSEKIGFMLTEVNSSLLNSSTATNNAGGMDTRSLLGAQNFARMYALAMEYGATAVTMWSTKEGGGTNNDIGYLAGSTSEKRGTLVSFQNVSRPLQWHILSR